MDKKYVYKHKGRVYLNKNIFTQQGYLTVTEVTEKIASGDIIKLELIVGDEYDPLYHKIDLQQGEIREGKYTLNILQDTTKVSKDEENEFVIHERVPENAPYVNLPSYLVDKLDPSWIMKEGTFQPTEINIFRAQMIPHIEGLVLDLRNKATKFKTIEERNLFTAYGEAALRMQHSREYVRDKSMFEQEAAIRGITPTELIEKTVTKYNDYTLINRLLSASLDMAIMKMERSISVFMLIDQLRESRYEIRNLYNYHINKIEGLT